MATQLSRTFSAQGNQRKFTISVWIKRTSLSQQSIFGSGGGGAYATRMFFSGTDNIQWWNYYNNSYAGRKYSTSNLRDTNGYYHCVFRCDTANSTASERMRMYVNGEEVTDLGTNDNPSQNVTFEIGHTGVHYIGGYGTGADGDCIMSHFHYCDGQSYAPTEFGETDSTTGEWKIKTDTSVSYGTSGSFILEDGNSVTDQSGLGNNWTVANGTLTKTEDNPSNVFCTFMSHTTSSLLTLSNGSTTVTTNSSSNSGDSLASLGASSGKFYWEVEIDNKVGGVPYWGVVYTDNAKFGLQNLAGGAGSPWGEVFALSAGGAFYNGTGNGGNIATGAWSSGDICGMAYDFDNGAMYAYKNGVAVGGGDPTSGASRTNAITTWTPNGVELVPVTEAYNGSIAKFNFGNGYFGSTQISSAGTNASGNGIFEHDCPTGYTALSTKGLNL